MLVRHGEPNKYDQFPKGTKMQVVLHKENIIDYYEQMSDDEENPNWLKIDCCKPECDKPGCVKY